MSDVWICQGGEVRIISGPENDPQRELRELPAWFVGREREVPYALMRPVPLDPQRVRAAADHWRRVLPERRG